MPKKYIQLLLSVNFCLTAIATATGSDANDDDSFVVDLNIGNNQHLFIISDEDEKNSGPNEPSLTEKLKESFYHIWHCLGKVNTIHPYPKPLQKLISEHQKGINNPVPYDESQEDLTQGIAFQFIHLRRNLQTLSEYQFEEELDEDNRAKLDTQFTEIHKNMDEIYNLYQSKIPLASNDQFFLDYQLNELLLFSQSFLAKIPETSLIEEDANASEDFADEPSLTIIELGDEFRHIWLYLKDISTIFSSDSLQRLVIRYGDGRENPYHNESIKEITTKSLDDQFMELNKFLKECSQRQPKEELDENNKAALETQFDHVENCFRIIEEAYNKKKESLSKREKFFLEDQLFELRFFLIGLIENSIEEESISKNETERLLDSCKEEDSLIYPQYEYIINSQETNVSDLLTSSPTQSNTQNRLLYFNKAEGLIELQHIEVNEGIEEFYTTTWRIRPADISLVKDWRKNDSITIDKTSIFSQYTMRGERLKYTLNNSKKSVRANFVCRSSNQNTYTVLSIDYLENIVVLKNGPCLFVSSGDLKEWHVKDTVVLQRSGSLPFTNTNNSHQLLNKTRSREIWVSLKQ